MATDTTNPCLVKLKKCVSKLKDLEREREAALKSYISQTASVMNEMGMGRGLSIGDLAPLVSDLYWNTIHIRPEYVADVFGLTMSQMLQILEPAEGQSKCRHCSKPMKAYTKSQSKAKDRPICAHCVEWRRGIHNQWYARCDKGGVASAVETERLRTMDYKKYLQTPHWKCVRKEALQRSRFRCQLCNSSDRLQVHHRTYDRRGCEEPNDVITLCRPCHAKFHDKF